MTAACPGDKVRLTRRNPSLLFSPEVVTLRLLLAYLESLLMKAAHPVG
jgi:hypothetical protein